mmetsp:Transcript_29341/g.44330  ORF Transcript_29341/g.44330 Transcript_29341/m.44330 type:complete len:173 (-) Transcript_29341:77-595(-)
MAVPSTLTFLTIIIVILATAVPHEATSDCFLSQGIMQYQNITNDQCLQVCPGLCTIINTVGSRLPSLTEAEQACALASFPDTLSCLSREMIRTNESEACSNAIDGINTIARVYSGKDLFPTTVADLEKLHCSTEVRKDILLIHSDGAVGQQVMSMAGIFVAVIHIIPLVMWI